MHGIVMILTVILEGISKAATVLLVLCKVYTIPCHDRGHINVIFVLQISSDSLHNLSSLSSDTNAKASDCAYHIGNMMVEEDLDMQGVDGEMYVKTEKGIGSEEACINIKNEEDIYSEEEEEENLDIKKEEDLGIKEEVSLEGTV